jgi:hypothetical protein
MDKKTTAELAAKAAQIAMEETAKECKKAGLTKSKVLKRIKEGLDAHIVKATYDKDMSGFAYSKPLIDHNVRLDAAKMAIELLRMNPPKQIEFPDETGKPQRITGDVFTDMERATRLVYLMNQAAKRKKADGEKRSGKD